MLRVGLDMLLELVWVYILLLVIRLLRLIIFSRLVCWLVLRDLM